AGNPQGMRAEVQESITKARNEPKNFEAQLKAAELYYQIQRYDQAIEFLLKANELQPTDYRTVAVLGMVNLGAGPLQPAEEVFPCSHEDKARRHNGTVGPGSGYFRKRRRESCSGCDCTTRESLSQKGGFAKGQRST